VEAKRFDQAVRGLSLAASRRRGAMALLGGLLAAALSVRETEAKRGGKRARHTGQKADRARGEGKKKKKKSKKSGGPRGPQVNPGPPPGPLPPPRPLPTCPACGACRRIDRGTGEMDLPCTQACVAATLCPQAQTHTGFLALWDELRARGFAQQGEPDAIQVRDAGSLARSIVIVHLSKTATGESAFIGFDIEANSERRTLAVVTDGERRPVYALLVDSGGQVSEARPESNPSRAGVGRSGAWNSSARAVVASCESDCEDDCEDAVGLGAGIFTVVIGIASIGTGGAAAVVGALLIGGFDYFALKTGLKCDDMCKAKCRCPAANCRDACNREYDACHAACQSGAPAGRASSIPPTCEEACLDTSFACDLACDEMCAS
jgi:hypothetical protein